MPFAILTYKRDQGRYVRGVAFALFLCLVWYGAKTFHDFLRWDWARNPLGFTIPVLEVQVTTGLLLAIALFGGLVLALRYALNQPKLADLLIETEGEIKRVTWPSWPDTWHGSIVVVITVVAMLLILAGFDFALNRIFSNVVFG